MKRRDFIKYTAPLAVGVTAALPLPVKAAEVADKEEWVRTIKIGKFREPQAGDYYTDGNSGEMYVYCDNEWMLVQELVDQATFVSKAFIRNKLGLKTPTGLT